ncbi:hypothetical protein EVAR_102890_1 [Eumeta japonica]|uniref:Uncharacterized protein n=1 Tax=Eumeta variegata TaxID=151549 RepID=A0A4C1UMJ3_EUMVA|nr:hypothetical protein EVAR_102890_1 [Eumeta japonica]
MTVFELTYEEIEKEDFYNKTDNLIVDVVEVISICEVSIGNEDDELANTRSITNAEAKEKVLKLVKLVIVHCMWIRLNSLKDHRSVVLFDDKMRFNHHAGYANQDRGASYHIASGTPGGPNQVVKGSFGSRSPATGQIHDTVYTAGPRGFRANGPDIHRKMDLDQRPRGPIGNKDDPYFDPNEDPSYAFKFNTRTYSKTENADGRGDVKGHYWYVDDAGERHDVSYIAGRDTGFHVSSAHPDAPNIIGSPFHHSPLVRGETKPRGRTAVQRGTDGSYRFISAGPDQRRTESSDSQGNVRGSYTFLDDKGVQRTVNYIAGPGIGYRIVKKINDPYIPSYFPTIPSAYDPDFANAAGAGSSGGGGGGGGYTPDDSSTDDVFKGPDGTAASGHVKPPPFSNGDKDRPGKNPSSGSSEGSNSDDQGAGNFGSQGSGYGQGSQGSGYDGGSQNLGFGQKPQNSGYGQGSQGGGTGGGYGSDEDAGGFGSGFDFGSKPRPTTSSGKPGKRPIRPGRPERPSKPFTTKKPFVPLKPFDKEPDSANGDAEKDNGPQYGVGFGINNRPGTTIIRNIGEDYFGVPPGVSVRAHVQSIDLYPYGSKPLSPSEAIEKDKT